MYSPIAVIEFSSQIIPSDNCKLSCCYSITTYRSHKVAEHSISLVALRTCPASPRSRHVDAVDPGVDATAAVVVEALVDVIAVEPVAAVARGT